MTSPTLVTRHDTLIIRKGMTTNIATAELEKLRTEVAEVRRLRKENQDLRKENQDLRHRERKRLRLAAPEESEDAK